VGETSEYVELLEVEVAPRLETQEEGYARNRQFAWLAWKPTFVGSPEAVAQPEGQLWERLQGLVPGIQLAECWRNGEGSSPGINPHRDAPYAANTAYVLNLGRTLFRIWLPNGASTPVGLRPKKVNARLTEFEIDLQGGELLAFDCKRLHGSRSDAEKRWGIGMWSWKPEWRQAAGLGTA
jgi:hypothetical protein